MEYWCLKKRKKMFGLLLFVFLVSNCFTEFRSIAQILAEDEVKPLEAISNKLQIKTWSISSQSVCSGSLVHVTVPDDILSNVSCNCNGTTVCHVTNIVLKDQNLTGTLPEEFANLTQLQVIDLTRNYIGGAILTSFAKLPLTNLSLFGNRINGSIPKEIGDIATLEALVLDNNQLGGELHPNLGSLSRLERLCLSANNFTGTIPKEFSNLKNLKDFRIDGSSLSGKIPDLIGSWTQIQRLDMQGTSMEGPIPSTISQLKNIVELKISDLNGSRTTEFPDLQGMNNLKILILRNCLITGPIPPYIGRLPNLKVLDLSFNMLNGQIPGSFQTSDLDYMFLTNNSLVGAVPNWLLQDNNNNLDLSHNNFVEPGSYSCQSSKVNLVSSYSSAERNATWCLKKDLPCSTTPKYHSLYINCGGDKETFEGNEYEGDLNKEGPSSFFPSQKWAYSSTGVFMDNMARGSYVANNKFSLNLTGSDIYATARLAPNSLKYYGLCLRKGSYNVKLHFAEIMFSDDQTYKSLGRRVFDVSI